MKVDAERVLAKVGAHIRQILEVLQEGQLAPKDLEQLLDLHKTLCWRILQIAYARKPLGVASSLPGSEGMEMFLVAAGKRGVRPELLNAVRDDLKLYRSLVKAHAGDRASFEVMLQGLADPDDSTVNLRAARRAGFRSASYSWGVQIAARILSTIITPVGQEHVDLATVRGHVRARRVRTEGYLRLSRTIEHDSDRPGPRRAVALPIVPESVVGGVPLLPQFSTQPLPKLKAVELADGNIEYRFAEQQVGEQSAITVFAGEVRRELSGARWRDESNSTNALMMTIRDPVALGVIDLWAPPGFGVEHRGLVVSAVGVDPLVQPPAQWHVLPATAEVERMGSGLLAARMREVPEYADVMQHCFERLGWNPEEFELFRVMQEYPMLGSCLVLQTELPQRP